MKKMKLVKIPPVDKTKPPYDEWMFDCFLNSGHSVDVTCSKWLVEREQLENVIRQKIKDKFAEYDLEIQSLRDRLNSLDMESFAE